MEIIMKYKNNLEKKQNFIYFLITPDKCNLSIFHNLILCKNIEFHKILWMEILNIDSWDDLKNLKGSNQNLKGLVHIFAEFQGNYFKENILHSAINESNFEIFQLLLEILDIVASENEIREILSSKSNNGHLLYITARCCNSITVIEFLWNFYCSHFDNNEMMNLINIKVNEKNSQNNFDVLENAILNKNFKNLEFLWNKFATLQNRNKVNDYLRENFKNIYKLTQIVYCNETRKCHQEWLQNIIVHYHEFLIDVKMDKGDDACKNFLRNSIKSMNKDGTIFPSIFINF